MRIYVPATVAQLSAPHLEPAVATAVTEGVRKHAAGGAAAPKDDEELEFLAFNTAGALAATLVTDKPGRRVVISADINESSIDNADEQAPGLIELTEPVQWADVAAIHVDDDTAAETLERLSNDEMPDMDAFDELTMLWFDPTERQALIESLEQGHLP